MDENNELKPKTVIEVIDFGPLKITGKFVLKDTKRDQEISADEILLCICGRSEKKPFCDKSCEK